MPEREKQKSVNGVGAPKREGRNGTEKFGNFKSPNKELGIKSATSSITGEGDKLRKFGRAVRGKSKPQAGADTRGDSKDRSCSRRELSWCPPVWDHSTCDIRPSERPGITKGKYRTCGEVGKWKRFDSEQRLERKRDKKATKRGGTPFQNITRLLRAGTGHAKG